MRLGNLVGALVFTTLCGGPALSQDANRTINITTDSAAGWLPNEQLEQKAQQAMIAYQFALANGEIEEAYRMTTPVFRKNHSLEQFKKFNARVWTGSGAIKLGRVVKITWTKDPKAEQSAPRGIYAAIDTALKMENVDRHCGYVVVYAPNENTPFQVMRDENNMISNSGAQKIVKRQGKAALDKIWSQMVQSCPGGWPG